MTGTVELERIDRDVEDAQRNLRWAVMTAQRVDAALGSAIWEAICDLDDAVARLDALLRREVAP